MVRALVMASILLCGAGRAWGHFVFVLPSADGKHLQLVLSEELAPDENVDIGITKGARLVVRGPAGEETPLEFAVREHALEAPLTGEGLRVVRGECEVGIMQRGNSKPFLLVYHPKTILGDAFAKATELGDDAPVEIVPVGAPGEVRFQLRAGGKPVADAEITVILPDGNQEQAKTDAQGETSSFSQKGRYGAWARHFEPTAGERDGKRFEETRRYATLVADIPAASGSAK